MPSPTEQPPERARLRALIEQRRDDLDETWAQICARGELPYETLRRVRTGASPIAPETRERIDDGLRWDRGSVAAILRGGDPSPLEDVERYPVERQILDTPIGQVVREIYSDLEADDGLTPEQRAEIRERTAIRLREEITMMVQAKRWQNEERRREQESDTDANGG